jgi:hypothetical protein
VPSRTPPQRATNAAAAPPPQQPRSAPAQPGFNL